MNRLAAAVAFAVCSSFAGAASAAPPWVERGVTLPGRDWAFDFGAGVAHGRGDFDHTGPGINAEMAVAPVDRLELGLRTGIRIGDDGRLTQADYYGRLFDRQTFVTGTNVLANPEFRVRGALVRGDVVELALEGRIVLPFETGTHPIATFGMPLMFHIGHRVRLDTGVYTPIFFNEKRDGSALVLVSAPIDVWIQITNRVWLGPMSGFVYNGSADRVDWSLGFGFGYQITHAIDFKSMLLLPAINHNDTQGNFGLGAGVQLRIE